MGEVHVDPVFILDPEHRPKLHNQNQAESIPIIDLSPLNSQDPDPKTIEKLAKEIDDACRDWGFFQVINHGVPMEVMHNIDKARKMFFHLPLEEKRKIRRAEREGYGYYDAEFTKNVRDWKEVFDYAVKEPTVIPASPDPEDKEVAEWPNKWPEQPRELRVACEEYAEAAEKVARKVLELIAMGLGLPAERFNGYFNEQTSFIRLNYYPPCPSPDLALGCGRHKDGGGFTVLSQDDVGGLEVKRKTDGEWVAVKPDPTAFIINVGDLVQVWSNDRYESVEHRAKLNSNKERYSISYGFHPAHYTVVKPLEELTDEQNPPKYRPVNWGKFLVNRKLTNFKKLNTENLQIHHFKVSEE